MVDGCQHLGSASGVSGQRPMNRFHEGGHARPLVFSAATELSFLADRYIMFACCHVGTFGPWVAALLAVWRSKQ